MSWSIECVGTPSGVAKRVTEELDKIAAGYAGQEEAKDVLAAKERILSLINACLMGKDNYTYWNGVKVSAGGSHSTMSPTGIMSATMTITVSRTALAI